MPKRPKVEALPNDVRQELDKRLVRAAFGGYVELSAWLADHGYEIGKSALHKYGGRLERRIEAIRLSTQEAEALVGAAPDDTGALADAVLRMAQARIFELMMAAEEGDLKVLASTARALADTVRAGTTVRAERRKALAEAGARADAVVKKAGLTPGTAAAIRAAIQGEQAA